MGERICTPFCVKWTTTVVGVKKDGWIPCNEPFANTENWPSYQERVENGDVDVL